MPRLHSRNLQVETLIQRELAWILHRDMSDARLRVLTITAVSVSKDLRFADVGILPLEETLPQEVLLSTLKKAAAHLRYQLAQRLNLRTTPRLHFHYDRQLLSAARLQAKIEAAILRDTHTRENET